MGKQLTLEQRVLLNLTALSISSEPERLVLSTDVIEGVNWDEVLKESISQAVTLGCFDSLKYYKEIVPEGIHNFWMRGAMRILNHNASVIKAQKNVVDIQNNQPYVILKGLASAHYYTNPSLRILGDVDFLIDPVSKQMLRDRYVSHGYAPSQADHPSHEVFRKDDEHLEMHFEVAGIPYGRVGDAVRQKLVDTMDTAVKRVYEGHEYMAPDDIHHAIILLLHMQHHMSGEGFGLRHLVDWATYILSTHDKPCWDTLKSILIDIGLWRYALYMTQLCVKYLDIPRPKWAMVDDDMVVDALMIDIFEGGNFGIKDENRRHSGMLISERGKGGTRHSAIYNLMHTLHLNILRQHPIVKKVWILYPFVYMYKVLRYAFLTLVGKRPNLIGMMPEAKQRKSIYEKLAVFEIQNEEK